MSWARLQSLYHAALEHPAHEREAFLNQACAGEVGLRDEVASLLAYETGDGSSSDPLLPRWGDLEPGSMLGVYQIEEALGRGGMGIVYRAMQREPVRRAVAVKVIKPGMDSQSVIARFQAERQALALMDHPNIARVYDAGATASGRLFFVMELVEGLTLNEYVTQHGLDLRARLALFISLCHAIQHAHQKGIIHRDIKPSNVLVTVYDGQAVPKVIDFGIAKALTGTDTQATQVGLLIGTPEYMSPEQADLAGDLADVDTRSDIYSLGTLLYELITGSTPLSLAKLAGDDSQDQLRRIRQEEPPAPSVRLGRVALAREVRGDLDWVVMRALEKDRTRRYATVGDFAEDLERYLDGDPVSAGPPSAIYRAKKLAGRYRGALAATAAGILLLLSATLYSAREAMLARRAERSAAAISDFLRQDLLAQASADVQAGFTSSTRPDPDLKVRTALDRAAARAATKFAGEPLLEASVRHTIGATYADLGLFPAAQQQVLRAVSLRQQGLGANDAATLASDALLAQIYLGLGQPKQAEPIASRLLEMRRQTLGEQHPDTLTALYQVASVERAFKRTARAMTLYSQVAEERRRVLGPVHPDTLAAQSSLGSAYMLQDKFNEAVEVHQNVLTIRRRTLGEEHPVTMESRHALSQALLNTGQGAQAAVLLDEVLPWRRRTLGPGHPDTLATLNALALAHDASGHREEAQKLYAECIAVGSASLGEHHQAAEGCRRNYANSLYFSGNYAESQRAYQKIVAWDIQQQGADSPDALRDMSNLSIALAHAGHPAEGRTMLAQVVAARQRVLGVKDPKTLSSMNSLALLDLDQRRFATARALLEEVAALRRQVLGARNQRTLSTVTSLANVMLEQGEFTSAEPLLREALAATVKDPWSQALRRSLLGWSLAGQHRFAEAGPLLRDSHHELSQLQGGRPADERGEAKNAERRLRLLPR